MRRFLPLLILSLLAVIAVSNFSFSQAISTAAVTSTYRGDIDENGKVDIFDLVSLVKALGGEPLTDRQRQIADVNTSGNGKVDVSDLQALLKLLRGAELERIYWGRPTLVLIPGGTFRMGSTADSDEQPIHTVTVSAFEMARTEVTQAQYETMTGTNPSYYTGDNSRPVEMVSWGEAATFCNKLSEAEGLESCYDLSTWECDFSKNGFRLPTEAEWEYACHAGTTTKYYTGDKESDFAKAGWYASNSNRTTHAVGGKETNSFGLYDMHGNVEEWCNDWKDSYSSENATDPQGPNPCSSRVTRGGSWGDSAVFCRSASRRSKSTSCVGELTGFRVVRSVLSTGLQ